MSAAAKTKPEMRGATSALYDILESLRETGPDDASLDDASPGDANLDDTKPGQAKFGDVIDALDQRAFGFLLFLFALPCCLPFVYLLPQLVALPMLALAGQMATGGRHPWLPQKLHERSFSIDTFQGVIIRAAKYGGWIERIATPRLAPISGRLGSRIVGALLLIPIASILTPLPSTNTVPGIGVAVASLGLIERDGVLVILGLLIGFAWVFLLVFLGAEAVQFLKDWITARTS